MRDRENTPSFDMIKSIFVFPGYMQIRLDPPPIKKVLVMNLQQNCKVVLSISFKCFSDAFTHSFFDIWELSDLPRTHEVLVENVNPN